MTTTSSVRVWIAAILAWAQANRLDIIRFCNTDASVRLPAGKLYISSNNPDSWRLSTLGNGSLDDDHTVVTETPDGRARIRRGPVGGLKDTPYPPDTTDSQKLADASRSIAELLNGRLRADFLARFTGEAAS